KQIIGVEIIPQAIEDAKINAKINNINNGTTINYLSIKNLKNIEIILPPIELQNQFADFVKQTEEIKEKVQKSLDETQVLFDKLMQDYF
ncbi:restriction endonuclease subunit S, partial [uncultured Anaerofustis sp.]|uniref:restriction endonuclease subunit S n=1 Tax=uncultured Anaerofustis sp. TaxID=904996 RepID=UPI0025F6D7DD